MSKKVGKFLIEAVCPLCDSIYLLEQSDVLDVSFEDDDKDQDPDRITFYCDDCERNVRAYRIKPVRVSTDYLRSRFHDEES